MFILTSKKQGRRLRKEVANLIQNGMEFIDKQRYKQAALEFNKASKISLSVTKVMLEEHYKRFEYSSDFSATLAVGLLLLKIDNSNYMLANVLGNCSRKELMYRQANDLYRYALKLQKTYQLPYYNLAASMAKVELYDLDVKNALDRFPKKQKYVLPDYAVSPDFIEKILGKLTVLRQKAEDKRLTQLLGEKTEGKANDEPPQIHRPENVVQNGTPPVPDYDDVCRYIKLMIKQLSKKSSRNTKNSQRVLDYNYNLCLYALENNDGEQAAKALRNIKSLGGKYEFYDMLKGLAYVMKNDVKRGIRLFINLLGKNRTNRFYNVNLGLVYRNSGNKLLSYKYLLIAAVLLEKSEGLYKLSDLMKAADKYSSNGRARKALELYRVIASEKVSSEAWEKMGNIYLQLENLEEAAKAFQSLQKIVPDSPVANDNLRQIHDFFVDEAEELFKEHKYKSAAIEFETALSVLRLPETFEKAVSVYVVLCNKKRSTELREEGEKIKKELHEKEQEQLRQKYILQGKKFKKSNMIKKAIESFELAFELKLDKEVFVFLAYLYKSTNKRNELKNLLKRWNKMVELDDHAKKYDKK